MDCGRASGSGTGRGGARAAASGTRGVTLVELLVVLTILGVMAGLAGLAARESRPADRGASADAPGSIISTARRDAIRSGRSVTVRVMAGERELHVIALPDGRVIGGGPLGVETLTGRIVGPGGGEGTPRP